MEEPAKSIFGSQFSQITKTTFHKTNSTNNPDSINVCVFALNLSKLLDPKNSKLRSLVKKKLKLDRYRDLIHSVCALYDNSLPDIGASPIYDCICAHKAYTILVVKQNEPDQDPAEDVEADTQTIYASTDCLATLEENLEEPGSLFKEVFSDFDEESEESDEDEDSEDFTIGLKSFLDANSSSRMDITKNLVACATLQKTYTHQLPNQDEWILDLELMSVRKKYRGYSIGKYLISTIQNRGIVGGFDAIVTSSDLDAIEFYEKYGFSVDPILNSKYSDVGDIWTNTTKMCYVPPYCSLVVKKSELETEEAGKGDDSFIAELTKMENEFKRWQKLTFGAYQSQAQIFGKLKQEVFTLKAKLCAKDSIIEDLKMENDVLVRKNRFLANQIKSLEIDKEIDDIIKN